MSENRAMLLTGAGAAAVAVVRLRGPGVSAFLERYFSKPAKVGRCVHGELRDGDHVLDDPLVVKVADDVVDVNVHGGLWVGSSVLELARREGFEIVEEIHGDAFDVPSEIEREMLMSLPHARTREGLEMLLAQPRAWESVSKTDAAWMLEDRSLWWMLHPPRVAIVGAPNVGKSTLANQLFAQQRSITANVPGTTRDWVGEIANVDGLAVMLVDTPGTRETRDEIEARAIEKSLEVVERAELVIRVVEARNTVDVTPSEAEILVINKCDSATPQAAGIRTVATTGEGLDELRAAIRRHFQCEDLSPGRARWWTQRQRDVLEQISSSGGRAQRRP